MKTIKVAETTERQLDWLVAKCEGHQWRCSWMLEKDGFVAWQSYEEAWGNPTPSYSTNPAQGHPILEREQIATSYVPQDMWVAKCKGYSGEGPTLLIAAMRCYVASKLGETVEVPEELT